MNAKKKILFLITEDWYFLSHRLGIARFLQKKGFEVHVCCKDTGKGALISSYNFIFHNTDMKRTSVSLIKFLKEALRIFNIIKKIKPDLVHLISLRPIVLGCLILLVKKNINICMTFTGLGYIFISKSIKNVFLRILIINIFRISLKKVNFKVIIQNKDDFTYFLKKNVFKEDKIDIIRGSGINLKHYKFYPEPKNKYITVCYTGRMLKDKGVHWLVQAFKQAKKEVKNLRLFLAGSLDINNPTALSRKEFADILKIKNIHYLGNVNDIKRVLNKANICVLLSKREGLPLALMEAAATGRCIIATDVPGCREIALNNVNAITVPLGDINKIKDAMVKLSSNRTLRLNLAKRGRKVVESDMSTNQVYEKYLKIYNKLS